MENQPMQEDNIRNRLESIDTIQARRYSKLCGDAFEVANQGIRRHLRACDRMDVNPVSAMIREIIDDAVNGRRVFTCGAGYHGG